MPCPTGSFKTEEKVNPVWLPARDYSRRKKYSEYEVLLEISAQQPGTREVGGSHAAIQTRRGRMPIRRHRNVVTVRKQVSIAQTARSMPLLCHELIDEQNPARPRFLSKRICGQGYGLQFLLSRQG